MGTWFGYIRGVDKAICVVNLPNPATYEQHLDWFTRGDGKRTYDVLIPSKTLIVSNYENEAISYARHWFEQDYGFEFVFLNGHYFVVDFKDPNTQHTFKDRFRKVIT